MHCWKHLMLKISNLHVIIFADGIKKLSKQLQSSRDQSCKVEGQCLVKAQPVDNVKSIYSTASHSRIASRMLAVAQCFFPMASAASDQRKLPWPWNRPRYAKGRQLRERSCDQGRWSWRWSAVMPHGMQPVACQSLCQIKKNGEAEHIKLMALRC